MNLFFWETIYFLYNKFISKILNFNVYVASAAKKFADQAIF